MAILLLILPLLFLQKAGEPLCERGPLLDADRAYCAQLERARE